MSDDDPLETLATKLRAERERYMAEVQESRPFQNALNYLESITAHMLIGQTYVRLMGTRFSAENDYLLFRFAPHLSEAALAVTSCAREGMQNAARRELRFLLEAAVKLSSRDSHGDAATFEERLAGLGDRSKRFEDYVAELRYFDEFEEPEEANAEILSLYSELSHYVHASVPQFESSMARSRRGESAGMETVATLNKFNKLAFRVYDLALVRIFHGVDLSLAGDIFTTALDDQPKWRFHKGKFVGRMSRCFDYKHERRVRRGEI
ncbi:MAG TPA: hypothetical protein DEG79_01600 [Hyphomonas sp.]|nr:hypothetical protein [Hyphomonas sp.]|tara:strand:- start:1916 stop:2710 length:795 start_codon:yes stop_codon:yes gene_type:complete